MTITTLAGIAPHSNQYFVEFLGFKNHATGIISCRGYCASFDRQGKRCNISRSIKGRPAIDRIMINAMDVDVDGKGLWRAVEDEIGNICCVYHRQGDIVVEELCFLIEEYRCHVLGWERAGSGSGSGKQEQEVAPMELEVAMKETEVTLMDRLVAMEEKQVALQMMDVELEERLAIVRMLADKQAEAKFVKLKQEGKMLQAESVKQKDAAVEVLAMIKARKTVDDKQHVTEETTAVGGEEPTALGVYADQEFLDEYDARLRIAELTKQDDGAGVADVKCIKKTKTDADATLGFHADGDASDVQLEQVMTPMQSQSAHAADILSLTKAAIKMKAAIAFAVDGDSHDDLHTRVRHPTLEEQERRAAADRRDITSELKTEYDTMQMASETRSKEALSDAHTPSDEGTEGESEGPTQQSWAALSKRWAGMV